ncbi:hypothetical protein SESBI_29220 [Sesbania bispinosa]|nr:hypothetical protein SESBI_29220 [Sesbania bispinosa]
MMKFIMKMIVIDSDEVNEEEGDSDHGNDILDAEVGGGVSRRIIDLTIDDICALEFCSENDAFNFYFSYARCHGFAVRRDDVIKDSKDSHNHELTPAKFVPLIPAYRGLSDGDKAQVDALHSHGVRPCQIMGFLVDQKGGYRNVGFQRKIYTTT